MAKPRRLLSALILVLTVLTLLDVSLGANFTRTKVDISCSTVTMQLSACLPFITDKADKPSVQCCSGAKQMGAMVKTKPDRQAVCECIKTTLSKFSNVDYGRINEITKVCGVKINLPPITKDTDCKSIPLKDLIA